MKLLQTKITLSLILTVSICLCASLVYANESPGEGNRNINDGAVNINGRPLGEVRGTPYSIDILGRNVGVVTGPSSSVGGSNKTLSKSLDFSVGDVYNRKAVYIKDPYLHMTLNRISGVLPGKLIFSYMGSPCPPEIDDKLPKDPVIPTGGKFSLPVTDIDVGGNSAKTGNPLRLSRVYSSQSTYDGPFGYGWQADFNNVLEVHGAIGSEGEGIVIRDRDGSLKYFVLTEDDSGVPYYESPDCETSTLTFEDGNFVWTKKYGTRYIFSPVVGDRLVRIEDRYGNRIDYTYEVIIHDETYYLVTGITDDAGRSIEFSYQMTFGETLTAHITSARDPLGREFHYRYDPNDNLIMVTDPLGNVTRYEYGDLIDIHNMTAIIDPEGNRTELIYNEEDRVISTVDAEGNISSFEYDVFLSQTTVTDMAGEESIYIYNQSKISNVFDSYGEIQYEYNFRSDRTGLFDRNDRRSYWEYDNNGNATSKTLPSGAAWRYEYTSQFNRQRSITDPLGYTLTKTFDGSGNITGVTDFSGNTEFFTYDGEGNLAGYTDACGNAHSYTYNDIGKLTQHQSPTGEITSLAYDLVGNCTSITNPDGNTVTMEYDNLDRLEQITFPDGTQENYEYDRNSRLTTLTDASGKVTTFSYNRLNQLTEAAYPEGVSITYTHDPFGNTTRITDANGNTTNYTYDQLNRLTQATDALGNTTHTSYVGSGDCKRCGAAEKPSSITDANGHTTRYDYDEDYNLAAIDYPEVDGHTPTVLNTYDSAGNLITKTDPNGNTTSYSYDGESRLISVQDALGNIVNNQYDGVGNLISVTDPNGNTKNYLYNENNRLEEETDALGNTTSYSYNNMGYLTSITDANGNTIYYEYDIRGRRTSKTDPLGNTTHYEYDTAGNLTSKTDPDDNTTTYGYNELNRLTAVNYPDGTSTGYTYDNNGNRLSMTDTTGTTSYQYDQINRLTQVTYPDGKTVSYSYDPAGNRISMTDPDGGVTQYIYDVLDRVISINTTTYEYDIGSRRTQMNYPNGVVTNYAYDEANRLINLTSTNGDIITDFTYSYDNAGNVITMLDLEGITSYSYDLLHRLTGVTYPDGDITTYTYDRLGNRLTKTTNGATTTYQYNQANQLLEMHEPASGSVTVQGTVDEDCTVTVNGVNATVNDGTFTASNVPLNPGDNPIEAIAEDLAGNPSTDSINVTYAIEDGVIDTAFGYDNRGNLTQKNREGEITTYSYDHENRLTSVNTNITYQYNADGQRLTKTVSGTPTHYIYDSVNVIQELDNTGTLQAAYTYGPRTDEITSQDREGMVNYYHTDAQGTVRSLTDPTGAIATNYNYDAFGEIKQQVGSIVNPYNFTGRRLDPETGLYYYRARYYDSAIGRFLQTDPIGYTDGLNLYSYVDNNPVRYTDPLGLWKSDCPFTKEQIAFFLEVLAALLEGGSVNLNVDLGNGLWGVSGEVSISLEGINARVGGGWGVLSGAALTVTENIGDTGGWGITASSSGGTGNLGYSASGTASMDGLGTSGGLGIGGGAGTTVTIGYEGEIKKW